MTNHHGDAVQLILSTRDLCGDEVSALADYQIEHDVKFTRLDLDYIHDAVAYQWRLSQQCAGVPQKYWVR
jgi:hypothetical protein